MSATSTRFDQFDVPVCNSFQEKVFNNQLCYEVDLNEVSQSHNIQKEIKLGFYFLMDYNEDRQVTFDNEVFRKKDFDMASSIIESDQDNKAFIYLNTIGKA